MLCYCLFDYSTLTITISLVIDKKIFQYHFFFKVSNIIQDHDEFFSFHNRSIQIQDITTRSHWANLYNNARCCLTRKCILKIWGNNSRKKKDNFLLCFTLKNYALTN